jgi:hypothetical protein
VKNLLIIGLSRFFGPIATFSSEFHSGVPLGSEISTSYSPRLAKEQILSVKHPQAPQVRYKSARPAPGADPSHSKLLFSAVHCSKFYHAQKKNKKKKLYFAKSAQIYLKNSISKKDSKRPKRHSNLIVNFWFTIPDSFDGSQ